MTRKTNGRVVLEKAWKEHRTATLVFISLFLLTMIGAVVVEVFSDPHEGVVHEHHPREVDASQVGRVSILSLGEKPVRSMIGKWRIYVVPSQCVNTPQCREFWPDGELEIVRQNAALAGQLWEHLAPDNIPFSVSVEMTRVYEIGKEPITFPTTQEGEWISPIIDQILGDYGITDLSGSYMQKVLRFSAHQREQLDLDFVGVFFVAPSHNTAGHRFPDGPSAISWVGGPMGIVAVPAGSYSNTEPFGQLNCSTFESVKRTPSTSPVARPISPHGVGPKPFVFMGREFRRPQWLHRRTQQQTSVCGSGLMFVFAHEMGHFPGGRDQYAGTKCTLRSGYLDKSTKEWFRDATLNRDATVGPGCNSPRHGGLMSGSGWELPKTTWNQIGWSDVGTIVGGTWIQRPDKRPDLLGVPVITDLNISETNINGVVRIRQVPISPGYDVPNNIKRIFIVVDGVFMEDIRIDDEIKTDQFFSVPAQKASSLKVYIETRFDESTVLVTEYFNKFYLPVVF